MRPALLLLAGAASCTSIKLFGRPQHMFEALVKSNSCGDIASISQCLLATADLQQLVEIEQCFIAGGCAEADATAGVAWFAHGHQQESEDEEPRHDLRRAERRDDDDSSSSVVESETAKTSDKSTAAETTESAEASSTAAPSSASATTTEDSSTATAATTSVSTVSSTTSASTTKASATTSSKETSTGTLQCYTTNTVSTQYCSTITGSKGSTTTSCVETSAAVSSCASGLLCTITNTNLTCMKADNSVGAAGITIAIIFGGTITAILVGILVMNHKAGVAAKKQKAEHKTFLETYKSRDVEAFRDAPQTVRSEANLPLIQEPGQMGYSEEFPDQGTRAPQLHRGLGSLA